MTDDITALVERAHAHTLEPWDIATDALLGELASALTAAQARIAELEAAAARHDYVWGQPTAELIEWQQNAGRLAEVEKDNTRLLANCSAYIDKLAEVEKERDAARAELEDAVYSSDKLNQENCVLRRERDTLKAFIREHLPAHVDEMLAALSDHQTEGEYVCVNGHDLCRGGWAAGPECPYCERKP